MSYRKYINFKRIPPPADFYLYIPIGKCPNFKFPASGGFLFVFPYRKSVNFKKIRLRRFLFVFRPCVRCQLRQKIRPARRQPRRPAS